MTSSRRELALRLLVRLLWAAAIALFAVTVAFLLACVVPADPARVLAGAHATPEIVARLRHQLALDRPLPVQYLHFVGRALRLDLGRSFASGQPVTRALAARVPATAELALAALLLEIPIGLGLALLAAWRRGRLLDRLLSSAALVTISGPTFVWGLLFAYLLGFRLGWFPIAGRGDGGIGDQLWHLALPALTLATGGTAYYFRLARGELVATLGTSFARTGRAKGLSEGRFLTRHALRHALLPVVALAGVDLGTLLGGAVLTEAIFGWPGVGDLVVRAIFQLDLPLLLGAVLLSALCVAGATLVADVLQLALDPRADG